MDTSRNSLEGRRDDWLADLDEWFEGEGRDREKLVEACHRIATLERELAEARAALGESLKLQSVYAELLNGYDGGKRRKFTADEWLARLAQLAALTEKP